MNTRLSLMVALCTVPAVQAGELAFVQAGKPVASIVVATDAPAAERLAAEELRGFLAAMSGARLPLVHQMPAGAESVVLVGAGAARLAGSKVLAASQLDEIEGDGYAINTLMDHSPPCIVLLGKEPRGTLYAVYELLESYLDCGFFCDGDYVPPRQLDIAVRPVSILGNPAFRLRGVYIPTHFYAPKRFQATLWNLSDWQHYIRWMAKKKMNCLIVDFSAASRAWGTAFDEAFPEAKKHRTEMLPEERATDTSHYTARLGWGLAPQYVTELRQKTLEYARSTAGFEILYIFHLGQFEPQLRMAHPKLKWLAPGNERLAIGTRCRTSCLDARDGKLRELQAKLWKAVVETYGQADHYLLSVESQPADGLPGKQLTDLGLGLLREVDKDARRLVPTWDSQRWGQTPAQKVYFLDALPEDVALVYFEPGFSIRSFHVNVEFSEQTLYWATRQFRDRAYIYSSKWGGGANNDLFENRFGVLRNLFRHYSGTYYPKTVAAAVARGRNAVGCFNWNEVRGVNPMMDYLTSEFAWTGLFQWRGEGAYTNPIVRRYLRGRYGRDAVFAISEAYKQLIRGAPLAEPMANYRSYARQEGENIEGTDAARAAIALALGCKDVAKDSPFYEPDLVDFGRNYLIQYLHDHYEAALQLVRDAKAAKKAGRYAPTDRDQALQSLQQVEGQIRAAQKTLVRLIATRKDMCLDHAILEAAATPGANPNLAKAVREHQSGIFADGYPLTDSVEYHQQLKPRQIAHFVQYVREELQDPSAEPIPEWKTFFLHGAADFVEKTKPTPYARKAEKAAPSVILEQFLKTTE
ncbi:MAG: alpha-glucuronidase family glycosyl hydrolase [Candidatus Brocadiia bacterium]